MESVKSKEELRLLFLDYLYSNGFNDPKIKNILEVSYCVRKSLSIILPKDRYNQFLLAKDVTPEALKEHGIKGARAGVFRGEMYYQVGEGSVPKEEDKMTDGPLISEFDALLTYGFGNAERHAIYSLKTIRKFVGQCVRFNKCNPKTFYDAMYEFERDYMNQECCKGHTLVSDFDSKENLGYYLIKKK